MLLSSLSTKYSGYSLNLIIFLWFSPVNTKRNRHLVIVYDCIIAYCHSYFFFFFRSLFRISCLESVLTRIGSFTFPYSSPQSRKKA